MIGNILKKYLIHSHPWIPVIYTLPKIHKDLPHPLGKLKVFGCESCFQLSARILDMLLQPYVQSGISFLLDTTHFLNKINDVDVFWEQCLLATMDVPSLYMNIPTEVFLVYREY